MIKIFYDNIGEGYRMSCSCGYVTPICFNIADAGEEMDIHLEDHPTEEERP